MTRVTVHQPTRQDPNAGGRRALASSSAGFAPLDRGIESPRTVSEEWEGWQSVSIPNRV